MFHRHHFTWLCALLKLPFQANVLVLSALMHINIYASVASVASCLKTKQTKRQKTEGYFLFVCLFVFYNGLKLPLAVQSVEMPSEYSLSLL